jgi:hypothetical protein
MDHVNPSEENRQDFVQIEMNEPFFRIHRGRRTVEEIKLACGVDPTHVIEQIGPDGQPTLLEDTASVTIKGGERFISHVRSGGSS